MIRSRFASIFAAFSLAVILLSVRQDPACAQVVGKQAFLPVTFTQVGWRNYGQEIAYSRWRYAFNNFRFYGKTRRNWLYVGCRRTLSIEGSRTGITTLMRFLPQTSTPRPLMTYQDYIVPIAIKDAGALAGEVVALTMNVAFNDTRMMPRSPGYDLELFKLRAGPMKGRTVGQVWDIANRILGGDHPMGYGIPNYQVITDVVSAINANYEYIGFNTYIDRGLLIPNRSFGKPDRPHDPHVP